MPGAMGYRSYVRVGASKYILPISSASAHEETAINLSRSIHGGGVGTTDGRYASIQNFAIGQNTAVGDLSGEVFAGTGNYGNAFKEIFKRAVGVSSSDISARDAGFTAAAPIIISPGGGVEWTFPKAGGASSKAVVGGMNISSRVGGNVEYTASIVSCGADFSATTPNAPNSPSTDFAYESTGTTDDSNPLPYWASAFTVTGSGEVSAMSERVTEWSIAINNNPVPIFTFDGNNYASDILLGMMEVSGSFTYYSPDGQFVRLLSHGASCVINFGLLTITLPYLAFGPYQVPVPGPNDPAVRTVQFNGLATSSAASIYVTGF